MKKLLLASSALAVLALAPSAQAADAWPAHGVYFGLNSGVVFQDKADVSLLSEKGKAKYDLGWGVGGSVGYGLGQYLPGVRTELEVGYRQATVDKLTGISSAKSSGGKISNLSGLVNVFYDIDTGSSWVPYVGAGAGISDVGVYNRYSAVDKKIDKSKVEFAYQAIAGVSYAIDSNWAVTADYRYFGTPDVKVSAAGGGKVKVENTSHNIFLGVRYSLDAPKVKTVALEPVAEPQVRPVVAPIVAAAPRNYVVFFDFNKATLTPEGKNIVALAAAEVKKGNLVNIEVVGHTDTSGSTAYNKKLSVRRANAVKSELVKLGVASKEIAARGVGEGDLLVPTADGVREAQNRRAEIFVK